MSHPGVRGLSYPLNGYIPTEFRLVPDLSSDSTEYLCTIPLPPGMHIAIGTALDLQAEDGQILLDYTVVGRKLILTKHPYRSIIFVCHPHLTEDHSESDPI